ncbi:Hypothetical predicted protein [Octopus vulgaris]|uniref:Uncharacterized protein n=1 Tax=Octopus vulgaris TaxID=6645 RepID=A0AA36AW53_OCTVU|nr:Hypothetical predicted protein [Octopus vulgaris]
MRFPRRDCVQVKQCIKFQRKHIYIYRQMKSMKSNLNIVKLHPTPEESYSKKKTYIYEYKKMGINQQWISDIMTTGTGELPVSAPLAPLSFTTWSFTGNVAFPEELCNTFINKTRDGDNDNDGDGDYGYESVDVEDIRWSRS